MQILGKRSKVLLIAVAVTMLVALGVSFAVWDTISTVKATTGNAAYSTAQVGDVIQYGEYYQDIDQIDVTTKEYKKTPIEWLVVDKDERTGQLTLISKYILACGSYFGNWYHDGIKADYAWNYSGGITEVGKVAYNQAYVDSTARAFLNNLERSDLGGDSVDATVGYIPSGKNSTQETGLLSSVGFSNQRYWTGYDTVTAPMLEGKSGIYKRPDVLYKNDSDKTPYHEYYYQRPIASDEYKARPVTRGFFAEAFTDEQKSMIVPKTIAGYIGHRWPDNAHDISTKSYVEGAVDKVWLPSVTELNIMNGQDWNGLPDDAWTNPSDEAGSTAFEYFKNYNQYKNPYADRVNTSVTDAVAAKRTTLAANGMAGNYSIPVYDLGTTNPKTEISSVYNTSDNYWTRSPSSPWYHYVHTVGTTGRFARYNTDLSYIGVRPCIILKY